jgi:hypothetical protein
MLNATTYHISSRRGEERSGEVRSGEVRDVRRDKACM